MILHQRYTKKQIERFDNAWVYFLKASVVVFSLIIAAPMIKVAVFETPLAWMAVPGYMALAGAGFFIFALIVNEIRQHAYLPWDSALKLSTWWDPMEEVESRLLRKEMDRAIQQDLQQVDLLPQRAQKEIQRFIKHPGGMYDLRVRDVKAFGRFMRKHGLVSNIEVMGSKQEMARRDNHIQKMEERLSHKWEDFLKVEEQEASKTDE